MTRFLVPALILSVFAVFFIVVPRTAAMDKGNNLMTVKPEGYPEATFAGGCFWCVESEFRSLDGVLFTRAGYEGGTKDNPAYRDVTTGETGYAEVVEVTYDPDIVSYDDLVRFFLTRAHDPTQLNRQGVDVGTQYRSAIFYKTAEQKTIAEKIIAELTAQKHFKKPIVTTVAPSSTFWEAEDYHQQYYEKYEEQNGQPHIRVLLKKSKKTLNGSH